MGYISVARGQEPTAKQSEVEWVEPQVAVACFPRIVQPENYDIEKFYRLLNEKYCTYVGPGHWFELPKNNFRIGFGWSGREELKQGLENINLVLQDAQK